MLEVFDLSGLPSPSRRHWALERSSLGSVSAPLSCSLLAWGGGGSLAPNVPLSGDRVGCSGLLALLLPSPGYGSNTPTEN